MKNLYKLAMISLLCTAIIFISGCDGDDGPKLTGESEVFDLAAMGTSGASGTVTFAKRDDNKTVITIQLAGTQASASHPAHIHANSAAQSGSIILDLENVAGGTGKSETIVTALNDGTPISYEELIAINGYVNVHLSAADLATLVAQGDVGQNELTGVQKVYTMNAVGTSGISGTVTFAERKSGLTLVTLALTGTGGVDRVAHIHANSVATTGPVVKDLTTVNGTTGKSATHVAALNNGTAITYAQLIAYNGYAQVHVGPAPAAGTPVSNGNIGSNAP